MISVIDYDGGNIKSILNVLKRCRIEYKLTSEEKIIAKSDKILLPGVSNFSYCMASLKNKGLDKIIKNEVAKNKKFLGICSGMQVLGSHSEEGNCEGLNIIKGKVVKFPKKSCKIVPHMGWNKIQIKKNILMSNIKNETRFYFCHSYYFVPDDKENIMLETNYHINFCSGIIQKNIFGIQFHPEKSHTAGLNILKKFSDI